MSYHLNLPRPKHIHFQSVTNKNHDLCTTTTTTVVIVVFIIIVVTTIIIIFTGFLFVVYGRNNDSPSFLVTGALFLILPFLLFGVFGMIVQCRQESQIEEKTEIKTEQPIERILTTTWLAELQISQNPSSDRCSWKSPLKQQELNTLRRPLNKRIAPKVMPLTLLCPFPILESDVGRKSWNLPIQWTSFILPCYSVNLAKWRLTWKDVQNRGVLYTPASGKIAPVTIYRRLLNVYGDQTAVVDTGGEWRFSSRYSNMREEACG